MDADVVVVGGGVSGLLSALTLSKQGKSVIVIEKSDVVGGNLRTYGVDGYTVDTGVHAITHVDNGPLKKLMDDYFDVRPKFKPFGDYMIRTPQGMKVFPWTLQAWMGFDVLPVKDRLLLMKMLVSSVAFNVFSSVDTNQSMYDFLKGYEFSEKTWKFIDTLSYFMSGKSMRQTPVWRLLKGARYKDETEHKSLSGKVSGYASSFRKLLSYDGSYHQAYPVDGVGAITDAILHSLPKDKVTIRTSETVKSFNGGDNISSVSTDKDTYDADLVVYSGYMKTLPSIAKNLPKDYVKQLNALEQTQSITLWLGLSEKIKEFDYVGSEIWFGFGGEKHYWAMPTSSYNSSFAPKGKQLIGFTSILEGDIKKEQKRLLESIYSAVPAAEKKTDFTHIQVTVPEKAAITVGAKFPGPGSPIKNLYLVGTDTDTRSMGVTRASFSVIEMLNLLKSRQKL